MTRQTFLHGPILLLLTATLVLCWTDVQPVQAQTQTEEPSSEEGDDLPPRIRALMDNSGSKTQARLWEDAFRRGLITEDDLARQDDPVRVRPAPRRAAPDTTKPRRPVIPESVIATVEPFATETLRRYEGTYSVVNHDEGRVVAGRVDSIEVPLEFHYRLPDRQELPVRADDKLSLDFEDTVLEASLSRSIVLQDEDGPLLAYLADTSEDPYERTIGDVQVQQTPTREDGEPTVTVRYGDAQVRLEIGQGGTLDAEPFPLQVYLIGSYASPSQSPGMTSRPYAVELVVYRAERGE